MNNVPYKLALHYRIISCKPPHAQQASFISMVSRACSPPDQWAGPLQYEHGSVVGIPRNFVKLLSIHCRVAGIRRYPEESPESDPTSCILCCSLTAVGGSKNGVKPELARIKTKKCWKKGGMVDWRVRGWGWLVVTGNGRPWNPDATMITTIITSSIPSNTV